jgi:6-phosphogluconolactonase
MSTLRSILISAAALAVLGVATPPAKGQYLAYVGTYTNQRPTPLSKGIYAYRFDAKTGKFASIGLAAETSSPSFLAIHPNHKFLYAANENAQGTVSAFAIDAATGMLKLLNSVSSKGSGPCHVSLDKTGKWLFAANYNSGSVASFPVRADGSLGEAISTVQHQGSSVDRSRQAGPHAHEAVVSPDNKLLFVPDLGLDKVMIYRIGADGALTPNEPPSIGVAPGYGPRHLAFHPNGKFVYVMTEMADSVLAFGYDGKGGTRAIRTISAVPADFTGLKSGAEIAVHPNGRFLYASNRNHNSIGIFTIDSNGAPTAAGNVSTQGKTPRFFELDPTGGYLIAANQDSANLVVFKIDQKTGGLTPTGDALELASPVCVAFVPAR